jgi:RHS repeat-associated protein
MHDSILAGNIWQGRGTYDVRLNPTLTGSVTCADITYASSIVGGGGSQTLGRGVLSSEGVQNRLGYPGYRYDHHLAGAERHLYHVRHRVYQAHIGRWATRDPLGYVDGMGLYEYVQSRPLFAIDPSGLVAFRETMSSGRTPQPTPPDCPPNGDDCVRSSKTWRECIDCCTVNNQTYLDCAQQCFDHKWDPRLDPDRNPPDWNHPRCLGNCLRYATCSPNPDDPMAEPPGLPDFGTRNCTCEQLRNAMKGIGALEARADGSCPANSYKIALLVDTDNCDMHFLRQDPNDRWTDKPGCHPVGPPYSDPEQEWKQRRRNIPSYYELFCGYMCWPYDKKLK